MGSMTVKIRVMILKNNKKYGINRTFILDMVP